ncbi:MAG: hypothetical protein GF398_05025 [Chitinivibrionales bacterium]|nr:hypothetical protein [Chitinivibrionales bacterium]
MKNDETRSTSFDWNTKQDLYNHFKMYCELEPEVIDAEIDAVMESFKPRKGESIKPQELWQKVGNNLAEKYNAPRPHKDEEAEFIVNSTEDGDTKVIGIEDGIATFEVDCPKEQDDAKAGKAAKATRNPATSDEEDAFDVSIDPDGESKPPAEAAGRSSGGDEVSFEVEDRKDSSSEEPAGSESPSLDEAVFEASPVAEREERKSDAPAQQSPENDDEGDDATFEVNV